DTTSEPDNDDPGERSPAHRSDAMNTPDPTASMSVSAAYRECERITREQARNFAYGITLLPPAKRKALSAVYAFARRVDDIGDAAPEHLCADQKLAGLDAADQQSQEPEKYPDDPGLTALAAAARRYERPLGAFSQLIEGGRSDVLGNSYENYNSRHCSRAHPPGIPRSVPRRRRVAVHTVSPRPPVPSGRGH